MVKDLLERLEFMRKVRSEAFMKEASPNKIPQALYRESAESCRRGESGELHSTLPWWAASDAFYGRDKTVTRKLHPGNCM